MCVISIDTNYKTIQKDTIKEHTGSKHAPNVYLNVKYIQKSNRENKKNKKQCF